MNDVAQIPLRRRDGSIRAYAIVDAADAAWVNQWRWHLDKDGYAFRLGVVEGRRTSVYLHRELLELKHGDAREGDHEDRDRLDCRRANLRALPKGGNNQNKSGYGATSRHRGVCLDGRTGKWRAYVMAEGTRRDLGRFNSEDEAADVARSSRLSLMRYATD